MHVFNRRMVWLPIALVCIALAIAFVWFNSQSEVVTNAPVATNQTTVDPLSELDAGRATLPGLDSLYNANAVISPLEGANLPQPVRDYTVLVYMVGSDLESSNGCASADLVEMMRSGFDPSRTNVIVYTGGSQRWQLSIPNNRNCVLELGSEQATVVAATNSSANMGSPNTLSDFVSWATQNYPSSHTALVIWDHGAGPVYGCGFDQLYRNDSLSIAEMQQAMHAAGYGGERKLDWVGFDACLMNSLEILKAWEQYAQFFVGSQDTEDAHGWDYAFLNKLDETQDARSITTEVVDSFGRFYASYTSMFSSPNVTLSAIDLSATQAIEDALDVLSDALLDDFKQGNFATAARAREQCRSFGSSDEGASYTTSLIDLLDFVHMLAQEHPEAAASMQDAMTQAVVLNTSNLSGANGVSLYYPVGSNQPSIDPITASYGRMLEAFGAQSGYAAEANWNLPFTDIASQLGFDAGNSTFSVGLEPVQYKSLASSRYTILADYEGRGYVPVVSNVPIKIDAAGNMQIPTDPTVFVMDDNTNAILPVEQIQNGPDGQLFSCVGAALLPGPEYVDASYSAVDASLTLLLGPATSEVGIASASLVSENPSVSNERMGLDFSHYKSLMLSYGGWQCPERADDGGMLAWQQWDEQGGEIVWSEFPLSGDLSFKTKHVSELVGNYYLQVVLTDINGTQHGTELIPLTSLSQTTTSVPTKNGTLEFVCNEENAALVGYRGKDERIEVPDTVDGLPVTEVASGALNNVWGVCEIVLPNTVDTIGSNALNCPQLESISLGDGLKTIGRDSLCRCSSLTSLTLPKGLLEIGRGSLRGMGVSKLSIPSSVEFIGEGALTQCTKLTSFELAEGCKAVTQKDGVLYSADGTVLVAFPAGRSGTFSVPSGVTTIGYGAFASTQLDAVQLPEGLLAIDNCAFYCGAYAERRTLGAVTLPGTLQSVGSYAFGSVYNGSELADTPEIEVLRLGANVEYVGSNAFTGLNVSRFEVDEQNESFSCPGGFLANKIGDTILETPSGAGQVVVVPEGVTTLQKGVFGLCDPGTDFVLPATVTRISLLAFPFHYEGSLTDAEESRVYDVKLHCAKDTAPAEFAERRHITWDTNTDAASLVSTQASITSGDASLSFLLWPDHAVLHGIDATQVAPGQELIIPSEVDGVPVTDIDGMQQSVGVPTMWKSVTLPDGLKSLDINAIPLLRSIEGFALTAQNETYKVTDGSLFSADGKTLVAFGLLRQSKGDGKGGQDIFAYGVPKGVRTIGEGAFLQSQLERVSLPASVRVIQKRAFLRNDELVDLRLNKGLERIEANAIGCADTTPELPDSLKYVGDAALGFAGFERLELPSKLTHLGARNLLSDNALDVGSNTLHIGRRMSYLGTGALCSANITAFEMDQKNDSFAAIDGLLVTKNGRKLLRCPAGRTGELHIPEGVLYLEPGCLEYATGLTDIYFPNAVIGVDPYITFDPDSPASNVTFHCAKNSPAARYAQAHHIAWVEE